MSWTDLYRPEMDLNPDFIPVLVAKVVDDEHWSVTCPDCGRVNTHSVGVGYRSSHCRCEAETRPNTMSGYVLAPPGASHMPYPDHCSACGLRTRFYTPIDLEPSEHRRGIAASYICDRGHEWGCYWGDPPFGPRPNTSPSGDRRCALYRHFDAAGVLLYVGISDAPVDRGKDHARYSDWVQYAARIEAEWLDSRQAAEREERKAIRTERPIFNVAHAAAHQAERARDYIERRTGKKATGW